MPSRFLPIGIVPATLFLTATLGVPFAVLAISSFWRADFFVIDHDLTAANYARLVAEPIFLQLIARSVGIGMIVAAVSVPLAFAVAYTINFPFRKYSGPLLVLVMVSMLSSYLVRIYAWKTILGPNGIINQLLIFFGLVHEPLGFLLYGDFALIVTLTHILVPFAVLPIFASLQDVDRSLLEAARDLGSSPAKAFLTIILPIARPGLISAFLFSFILASADYVTPQLVGGTNSVMIGRVIADQFGMAGDPPFGAVLSLALIFSYVVVIGLIMGLLRPLGKVFWWLTSVPSRPAKRRASRDWIDPTLSAMTIAVLAFLYLPLIILLVFSLNASSSGVFPIEAFSLRWYREFISSAAFLRAVRTSAVVGVATVVGALAIGVPAAFALSRRPFILKPAILALVIGPLAVPGIVIGTSLLASLQLFGRQGGLGPTILVHILFTLPFVVMVVRARLSAFDWQLEEAGRDLGSSAFKTARTVTFPLLAPALLGAGILVVALSLDEFIITNFVIGTQTTLPVYIWSQMRTGITPSVNAIASTILLSSTALIMLAGWLAGRHRSASR